MVRIVWKNKLSLLNFNAAQMIVQKLDYLVEKMWNLDPLCRFHEVNILPSVEHLNKAVENRE